MWKWTAIIVGLICAAFLALGFIHPVVHVTNSILVERSPAVAWKVFTDVPRTKDWLTGLHSIEIISGQQLAVGTRSKLVFFDGGRREELEETTTAVDPGKLYAFDASMDEFTGSTRVRLTPQGGGTQIVFESSYAGRSLLWRSIMAIMQSTIEKREAGDLAKLKALIEAEPQ